MHRRSRTNPTRRFWCCAVLPASKRHSPRQRPGNCQPSQLIGPIGRISQIGRIASVGCLICRPIRGQVSKAQHQRRWRRAPARVRGEGAANPSWRAGLFQAPDTAMPSGLTPPAVGSHLRRLASDPTWGAARLGTDAESRRARRSAREGPRLLPGSSSTGRRAAYRPPEQTGPRRRVPGTWSARPHFVGVEIRPTQRRNVTIRSGVVPHR